MTNFAERLMKKIEMSPEGKELIYSLVKSIRENERETEQHEKRVAVYTGILCRALGLSDLETRKISLASMMHDVGKIRVNSEILKTEGPLTDEEFEEIKKHTVYGKEILEDLPGEIMKIGAEIAYQHHEKFDGTGYPNGLKGEEINIYARCVTIADVFDALVSKRCYKNPWPVERARKEILAQSGRKFDPSLIALFDANFDEFKKVVKKYPDP